MQVRTAINRMERALHQVQRSNRSCANPPLQAAQRALNAVQKRAPVFEIRRAVSPNADRRCRLQRCDPEEPLREARAKIRAYIPYLVVLQEREPVETGAALRAETPGSERWLESMFALVNTHLFPLNEWAYEDALDSELVYLSPPNERESADSLYETLCDPTCLDPAAWFYWFLLYCDSRVDDDQWEVANRHFGWQVPPDEMPRVERMRWDVFEQLADPGMAAAYTFVAQATGNLVLDYSYEDAIQDTRYLATTENLRRLAGDWQVGQGWIRQFQQAERAASQNKAALRQFAAAMTASSTG